METISFTKEQARRFLLCWQGLLGDYRFSGKAGILDFIGQAGCIQFDPVDVCGKSPELVLHSRVKGFTKKLLYELLYEDRLLIDYFDKNLSIIPVTDWPLFERCRANHREWERSRGEVRAVSDRIKQMIAERGPVCSADLDMPDKVAWYWSETRLSRAALEHLYFTGELAVHHKKGNMKYYDLIENCVPAHILSCQDPFPDEHEHRKHRVFRRIGAVGLLWNRASDAWLNIEGLRAAERSAIFEELQQEERIAEVKVEGISDPLYLQAAGLELANRCRTDEKMKERCELIAPLDNLMWDRKLIRAVFDFDYKWEIYTPANQRKYGAYVLPILCGDRFIGRLEAVADRRARRLEVKNIWYEPYRKSGEPAAREKKRLETAIKRLERFHFPGENALME